MDNRKTLFASVAAAAAAATTTVGGGSVSEDEADGLRRYESFLAYVKRHFSRCDSAAGHSVALSVWTKWLWAAVFFFSTVCFCRCFAGGVFESLQLFLPTLWLFLFPITVIIYSSRQKLSVFPSVQSTELPRWCLIPVYRAVLLFCRVVIVEQLHCAPSLSILLLVPLLLLLVRALCRCTRGRHTTTRSSAAPLFKGRNVWSYLVVTVAGILTSGHTWLLL